MMGNDELVALPATALRVLIANGEVSPVELLDACAARIEAVNPAVNALAACRFQAARREAAKAEEDVLKRRDIGLLHGLPLGIKDIEDTAGLLSTMGSASFQDHVPKTDSALVRRLRAAGGIVAAKTNVPEMGVGANTRNPVWGATGNPFAPLRNAGGSSGGSAAALACDMLPLCTGSDTGGSLRIPAAKCGVVGMRPSPGLVPTDSRQLGWSPISVAGPMGRTVGDVALQLAAAAAFEDCDPLSSPVDPTMFLRLHEIDTTQLRVAWTPDFGACTIDEDMLGTFLQRMQDIAPLFACCERVSIDMSEAHYCFDVVRATSFVAGFRSMYEEDPSRLAPNVRLNYELGAAMRMEDIARAQQLQTALFRRFQSMMSSYDLVISPVTPVSPFPWTEPHAHVVGGKTLDNYYRWLALTYITTLVTNPSLALPCGRDPSGMPFALQITGRFRRDHALLSAAQAIEKRLAEHPLLRRPTPDLERLRMPVPELRADAHPPAAWSFSYADLRA